mmetsp:Transcript_95517/g.275800  ORF Transcript_95517/g.275800 Transcript_95517/m.275800 type:complete len:157 (+) Transcript_95517:42-512(+)
MGSDDGERVADGGGARWAANDDDDARSDVSTATDPEMPELIEATPAAAVMLSARREPPALLPPSMVGRLRNRGRLNAQQRQMLLMLVSKAARGEPSREPAICTIDEADRRGESWLAPLCISDAKPRHRPSTASDQGRPGANTQGSDGSRFCCSFGL